MPCKDVLAPCCWPPSPWLSVVACYLYCAGGPRFPQRGLLAPATALAASFHWFDRWWADARCDPSFTQHGWDDSGSTAVVGMVCGQELVVANAGALFA